MKGLIAETPQRKPTVRDMHRLNVGRRYWDCTLGKIPEECQYKHVLEKYVHNIQSNLDNGRGLLITGSPNKGKTGAGVICLKYTVAHGGTGLFYDASQLGRVFFSPRPMFDPYETIADRLLGVDLLVLDDVGSGHENSWNTAQIEHVVRSRSSNMQSTIVTTNLTKDELITRLGFGLYSVLSGCTVAVHCDGKDWRLDDLQEIRDNYGG
jgi:DNA replication protein DnaC